MYSGSFCFHVMVEAVVLSIQNPHISVLHKENWISWNIYTHVGIIHGICYYHLSNLSFKKFLVDFMSRRNDTQARITHTTMKYLLSMTEEQGLNCYLPFQSNTSETQRPATVVSVGMTAWVRGPKQYKGACSYQKHHCSISSNTRLRVLIVLS